MPQMSRAYSRAKNSGMTHTEIGRAMGISRQMVQIIERRAMQKLRRALGSSYRGSIHQFMADTCGFREVEHRW